MIGSGPWTVAEAVNISSDSTYTVIDIIIEGVFKARGMLVA